jgi:hypothetical protein
MKRLALVVVLVAGCTRDLELPGETAFEVTASPTTVAPRQASTITATGGSGSAGALAFDFDAGGKLSGDDAAIAPNGDGTATYTAGRNGSTQDTIVVRDGAGAERRVIVTVGPRVSITPLVGSTAPGGSLVFVASGGKSPYSFAVSPAGTGASVTVDPLDATRGLYVAGTTGDSEETVTVADATGDAAASASAVVRVGTQLGLYRTSTGLVAPNEEVTVVAYGGRAPYAFSPAWVPLAPEGGGFKDPTKGVFTVGTVGGGGTIATPTVTDQNGQSASVVMEVGATLSARLASPLVRPGLANRVVAAGGKPPFAFRFARHGNHSGGEVDAVSGSYLPGRSPGALDRLEVEDATGTVVAVGDVARVGPIEIATGRDVERCVAGDYDGDGTEDLAFLYRGMSLLEVNRVADANPVYRSYYVGTGFRFPAAFVHDHDGDGRDEIAMVGYREGTPQLGGGGTTGFWVLRPDITGLFDVPSTLMLNSLSGAQSTTLRDEAAGITYYFNDRMSLCSGGLDMVAWWDGLAGPGGALCSDPMANTAPLGSATGLVAGDFSGDGLADLAWLSASSDWIYQNTWNTPGPLHLRYRSGGVYADGGSLELPLGSFYEGEGNGEQNRILRIPPMPGGTQDGLLIRLRRGDGRGVIALATGNPLTWRFEQYDPFGGGLGTTSLVAYEPRPGAPVLVAAFSGADGRIAVFDPWATSPVAAVADVAFSPSFGCTVDADADGYPDLSMGGSASGTGLTVVLWGDGTGAFGRRPRLASGTPLGVSGDLDGDGLVDLVTSDGEALTAMFGDAGQLGWSESSITTLPAASAAVGRFVDLGAGSRAPLDSVLFQALGGDYYLVLTQADGSFGVPSHLAVSSDPQLDVPRVPHPFLLPADLGGYAGNDATGPDLIAPENDDYGHSWIHVLVRPDADLTIREHKSPVVGDYRFSTPPGGIDKTRQCAYAPVRTGVDHAVASLCSYEVPAGQPAAAWRVRGWPIAWATPGWYDLPWVTAGTGGENAGAAGTETSTAAIGELGGKAWFLVATDRLLLAKVDPGASALDPAGWTVTTTPLTTWRHATPVMARSVDLDGDGDLDVVAGGEGATVVLRNTGSDAAPVFQFAFEVPAAGFPLAAGALGFSDAAGAIPETPSVVLGGPRGSYFQLLRPDGGGGLQ